MRTLAQNLDGSRGPWASPIGRSAMSEPRLGIGDVIAEAARAASLGWLAFQFCLIAAVGAAMVAYGGPSFVITGRSMTPAISQGSVVVTSPGAAPNLAINDIVTFESSVRPGATVTHRVKRIVDDEIVTKGDANPNPDSAPIPTSAVRGTVRFVVPGIGLPYVWLAARNWGPMIGWFAADLGAIWIVVSGAHRTRRRWQRTLRRQGVC